MPAATILVTVVTTAMDVIATTLLITMITVLKIEIKILNMNTLIRVINLELNTQGLLVYCLLLSLRATEKRKSQLTEMKKYP